MNPSNSHAAHQESAATQSPAVPASRPRFPFAILFCVWLMVVVITTLVTMILPESFSSTARIKIEHDHPDIAGLAALEGPRSYDPYFIQTELEVIQSGLILGKAIQDLDLNKEWGKRYAGGERLKTPETMALLKSRLDLRPVRNTALIEIRAYSEKPAEAAILANAIAQAYRYHRQRQRVELSRGGIKALEEAYAENIAKLRAIRAEIAELSRAPNSQNTNRLDEPSKRLEDLQRFGQVLFMKIASEKADLNLPATAMVQIVDEAKPGLRPVRPNKPLNILVGILVGGGCGLFLAALVYVLQCREFRRRSAVPRRGFPPLFRAIARILIALLVGFVVGYLCANPFDTTTLIVVPLALLFGGFVVAFLELATSPLPTAPATAPSQTTPNGGAPKQ
jgi:capsular polysaccharide biosynthesis protein